MASEEEQGYPVGASGFGARLGMARRDLGNLRGGDVSKVELGEVVSVSGQTVGMWEAGDTKTDIETIERLATFLRVEPGWLAFGRGPKRATQTPLVQQPEADIPKLDIRAAEKIQRTLSRPVRPKDGPRKRRGGSA